MLSALSSPTASPLSLCISEPSCHFNPSISKPWAMRPASKWWLWQLSQISWLEPLPALLPCFKVVGATTEPDLPRLSHSLPCHLAVRQSSLAWFQGGRGFPSSHSVRGWLQESLTWLVHYKWPFDLGVGNSGKAITLNSDNDSLFVIPSLSPPP